MACHFDEEMADQQYNGPQIILEKLTDLGVTKVSDDVFLYKSFYR